MKALNFNWVCIKVLSDSILMEEDHRTFSKGSARIFLVEDF